MKRTFALAMLAATLCLTAAAKTSNEVIRDIRTDDKAFTVRLNWLTKTLLPGLADGALKGAMHHIRSGTIVTIDDGGEASKRKFLECVAQLDTCVYLPLARVCDEEETVQLFGRMKNGSIRELLVAVADDADCTLVRLKGRFTKEDVQRMLGNKN